jgi:UDP-N-acetylglucosamine 1-carboxyvinyltransferase
VGATEHAMLAAVLAQGETILENCAREPEIADLAACLNAMGARIEGAGADTIRIVGVTSLKEARHRVLPDRIEAGTYAIAAAATHGDVLLEGAVGDHIAMLLAKLEGMGIETASTNEGVRVRRVNGKLAPVDIDTQPYPGFPTDLQAQFMALMTLAAGVSHIRENIFENRFMHAPELARLGADIAVHGSEATVTGVEKLVGAPVMATDLRASVSLVVAGLAAEGETVVNRVYHLDRGFERLEEKLAACGARIERSAG